MGECVNFGIVPNIEYDKDYSFVGGPDAYGAIYAQYRCVSIPDDIVNAWIPLTNNMPTYLFSLSRRNMGIDHFGVTLIPPKSVKMLFDIICSCLPTTPNDSVTKLVKLLNDALEKSQCIICFGI